MVAKKFKKKDVEKRAYKSSLKANLFKESFEFAFKKEGVLKVDLAFISVKLKAQSEKFWKSLLYALNFKL